MTTTTAPIDFSTPPAAVLAEISHVCTSNGGALTLTEDFARMYLDLVDDAPIDWNLRSFAPSVNIHGVAYTGHDSCHLYDPATGLGVVIDTAVYRVVDGSVYRPARLDPVAD